ncbi:MAG: hypothetical protein QNK37_04680 [Acidobacteriota bacterium]|nr:hypothetical protein [Acidobacteriota bacterium]
MSKPRYWRRTIDSAQRTIGIPDPESSQSGLTGVIFEIQGVLVQYAGNNEQFTTYPDMAENGIRTENEKPLTIMQRLFRREANVGAAEFTGDERLRLVLWTSPKIDLFFDLSTEDGKILWRETEIMVRSAGFHFRLPEGMVKS